MRALLRPGCKHYSLCSRRCQTWVAVRIDQIDKRTISISRRKKDTEKRKWRAENRNCKTKTAMEAQAEKGRKVKCSREDKGGGWQGQERCE